MPGAAETERPPGAPRLPVLLVHGQPGSGAGLRPLATLLEEGSPVLTPDRPGWGRNEAAPCGLAQNAERLERLLEANGASRAAAVVGHSLGGGIAIELALRRPDLVGALVLVGSVGVSAALTGVDRLLAVPLLGDGVLRAGAAAIRAAADWAARFARSDRAAALVARAGHHGVVRFLMTDGRPLLSERERASFLVEQRALMEETPRIEARLGALRVPCAVVHGTADHIVSLTAARELAAAVPGGELVLVKGGGHLLPMERPEAVARVVRRYVRLGAASR